MDDTIAAAKQLPWLEHSDQFMRLVLLTPGVYRRAQNFEADRIGEDSGTGYDVLQVVVMAFMLEKCRDDHDNATLLAIATHIDDERQGTYSIQKARGVWVQQGEAMTRPIREVAREALVRNLGVDHGFDKEAWVEEIQQRL